MSLPQNDETPAGNEWERWAEGLVAGEPVLVYDVPAVFVRWENDAQAVVLRDDAEGTDTVAAVALSPPDADTDADTDTDKPPADMPYRLTDALAALGLAVRLGWKPPVGPSLDGLRRRLGVTGSSFHWRDLLREPLAWIGAGVLLGALVTWWELSPPPCQDWSGVTLGRSCPVGSYIARSEVVVRVPPDPPLVHLDCRCRALPRTDAPESRP